MAGLIILLALLIRKLGDKLKGRHSSQVKQG
jgi:hypothetical protein